MNDSANSLQPQTNSVFSGHSSVGLEKHQGNPEIKRFHTLGGGVQPVLRGPEPEDSDTLAELCGWR